MREQRKILEDKSYTTVLNPLAGNIFAIEEYAALIRMRQTTDELQELSLACPGAAQQNIVFATRHLKGYLPETEGVKSLAQLFSP